MDRSDTLTYRYRLKLAYDGGPFHGWQIQPSGISLQELLKKALQTILRDPSIHPIASGRTDAGVHAQAQIIHFDTVHNNLNLLKIVRSLNGLLPVQARVLAMESCSESFHARYSTIGKIYHYNIQTGPVEDPFYRKYRWHVYQKIDKNLLVKAFKALEGRHDLKGFAS
jgi:tRNA pseudouridine38-40 synthase